MHFLEKFISTIIYYITGVNIETPATTIGKVCASGLKSVLLGSASIWAGNNRCVVAGGFESMSNVPNYFN